MAWAKEGTLKPITEAESIISLAVPLCFPLSRESSKPKKAPET